MSWPPPGFHIWKREVDRMRSKKPVYRMVFWGIVLASVIVLGLWLTGREDAKPAAGPAAVGPAAAGPKAVSYTHLDVYKRQTLYCSHQFLFIESISQNI